MVTIQKGLARFLTISQRYKDELRYIVIEEPEQRELLVWFKNNKPELWREIFCDDCPEVC